MWIFTTAGFVSAVQDATDESVLVVRGRNRASVQVVIDAVELLGHGNPTLIVGAGTDYPYRTRVSREGFAAWLTHEVEHYLDYFNFKSAVAATEGKNGPSAPVLSRVWTAVYGLTDEEGWAHSPYAVQALDAATQED